MRGPIAGLMVESEQLELLGQVRRELLVLGARVLPVVDRAHLVEKLARFHRVCLQVDKETLVHVGVLAVVGQYHYAIVLDEGHGEQRLYAQVHAAVIDPEQAEVRLEAADRALLDRADELVRQLDLVPADDVQEALQLADGRRVPRDAQPRIERHPLARGEVELLYDIRVHILLLLPLQE